MAEKKERPRKIVATQNTGPRLEDLRERFTRLAVERGVELVLLNPKDLPLRPVKPRQHQDLVAFGNSLQSVGQPAVEYQPRLWRSLDSLLGRVR